MEWERLSPGHGNSWGSKVAINPEAWNGLRHRTEEDCHGSMRQIPSVSSTNLSAGRRRMRAWPSLYSDRANSMCKCRGLVFAFSYSLRATSYDNDFNWSSGQSSTCWYFQPRLHRESFGESVVIFITSTITIVPGATPETVIGTCK